MGEPRPDLPTLVGSRICHDLISPLGAISNGVELLAMSGAETTPEMALIAESVESANARVLFFRVAYGVAGTNQSLGRSEVTKILTDMTRNSRMTVEWNAEGDSLRAEVRLVFLALQCLETAMPAGGTVEITHHGDTWMLTARSQSLRINEDLWAMLTAPEPGGEVTAAQVQYALLPHSVQAVGRRIETHRPTPDEARIVF